ncbi:pyruvate kinase, partial [Candidatus Bathyarchaeota archaeon]
HGNHKVHNEIFENLQDVQGISTLIDLPGPKIRLGQVDGKLTVIPGDVIHFTTAPVLGSKKDLSVSYMYLPQEVKVGGSLFINDGVIEIRITEVDKDLQGFKGTTVSGGEITSNKGVNVPGANLSLRPPTEADLVGIKYGVGLCDWFAASFIRESSDVERVRQAIKNAGGEQPIISKIEHQEAILNIDSIIDASDGIMVARGDLGIEVPPWEVPLLQKHIIEKCRRVGKPVIVATQMLESMVSNPRPTRAEASDVANAILDGADAVMLSEETAIGLFPLESVRVMDNINRTIENKVSMGAVESKEIEGSIADIIGKLAREASDSLKPAAILVVTRTGFSARMVSKHRPQTPILAVAKDLRVKNMMRLFWGVEPLDVSWTEDRDELIKRSINDCLEIGHIKDDDRVMVVSGSSLEEPGRTSTLEILNVRDVLVHTKKAE